MDVSPELFIYSHGGLTTLICVSVSVATMTGLCLTVDKKLDLRCILTAPIAGGVIVGSSSTNIYSPLGALFLGVIAAGTQYVFNKI